MNKNLILGGGASGSALALLMQRSQIEFELIESSSELGGNARTIAYGEHLYDTGAHRLHNKIPEVTELWLELLGGQVQEVSAPSEIRWRDKRLRFPLHPLDLVKQLSFSDLARGFWDWFWNRHFLRLEPNFASDVRGQYGEWVAREFVLNYSQKLWGRPCDVLHSSVSGGRLKGLNVKTLIQELLGKEGNHLDGSFYYPDHGIGQLFDKIQKELSLEALRLETKVEQIDWDPERSELKRVHLKSTHEGASSESFEIPEGTHVWNTLPLPLLVRLLSPKPPQEIMDTLDRLQFRHLGIVVVKLQKNKISTNASLYFPDPQHPFTRLYEPSNRSEYMSPQGETLALLEIGLDDFPNEGDVQLLIDQSLKSAVKLGLWEETEVMDTRWEFLPFAYPIPMLDTPRRLGELREFLDPIGNLFHIGRGAEFQYTHLHDHFARAMDMVEDLRHH